MTGKERVNGLFLHDMYAHFYIYVFHIPNRKLISYHPTLVIHIKTN